MTQIKIVCTENKAVRNGEKLKKRIVAQSVVIFTLLLVPAFYALIFLGAYWNPISHMSDIPVAVVNNDEGISINGETTNIGNDLIESFKSNNQVNWIFTDKEDADAGVVSQEYYAELIIPNDFTKNITSAGSETKIQGTLYFKATDKKGMMASSMLDTLSSNIEATINKTVSESIINKLANSLESLPAGLQQLSDGLNQLEQGSAQLQQSVLAASPTSTPISQGLTKLNASIKLIKSSVDSSLTQVSQSTSVMTGLGQYISQPVIMEHSKIAEAENTGTALAPFMISLCLYIGGFMIMITIFGMDSIKFKDLKISKKIGFDLGSFRYQIIGIIQAILIGFSIHILLGLNMENVVGFYGTCILGSLAFTTLIQVLVMLFKSFGKILCLLFMVCQLTASGGVLPTEILPNFYKAMHPFMPMTYTINALRNTILGMESDNFQYNCGVLITITVISALFVILLSFLEYRKNQEVVI
jgi:putative membrane protein